DGATKGEEQRMNGAAPATKGVATAAVSLPVPQPVPAPRAEETTMTNGNNQPTQDLGQLLLQALNQIANQQASERWSAVGGRSSAYDRNAPPLGSVVISGAGLGLPGAEKLVMDPENAMRILRGEQFVDLIPERFRRLMLNKNITRLVKGADGSGHFETI